MSWQTDTINPAVTSPAVDITKITNDLQVLRDSLANNLDPDVPVVLDATKLDGQVPNGSLAASGTPSDTSFLAGDRVWRTVASPTIASTAEAVAGTNNTNLLTPLRMREGFNASGAAPVYAVRAWVNFSGTASPGTIRASGNVSSVTKNSTGEYTVNFTTAMPDANYVLNLTGGPPNANNGNQTWMSQSPNTNPTTAAFRIQSQSMGVGGSTYTSTDPVFVHVAVFR